MSQELFYTSAPSGLRPGSRGFCTVMSTSGMAKNLADRLEALSGYRHVFAPNDPNARLNPVVYSHLRITVGGSPLHVLSRVSAAGLDYTQRSNKFAHHVVLDPKEGVPAGPAALLAAPGFMESTWEGEPRVIGLGRKPPQLQVPPGVCKTWQQVTGDAGWGGVLAETAADGSSKTATVIFEPGTDTLTLVAESLALLPPELRWQVTFSTYFTKLPPEVQCQWRFVLKGSPEAKAAERSHGAFTIDLTESLGLPPAGRSATCARDGSRIESNARAVAGVAKEVATRDSLDLVEPVADESHLVAMTGGIAESDYSYLPKPPSLPPRLGTSDSRESRPYLTWGIAAAGGIFLAFILWFFFATSTVESLDALGNTNVAQSNKNAEHASSPAAGSADNSDKSMTGSAESTQDKDREAKEEANRRQEEETKRQEEEAAAKRKADEAAEAKRKAEEAVEAQRKADEAAEAERRAVADAARAQADAFRDLQLPFFDFEDAPPPKLGKEVPALLVSVPEKEASIRLSLLGTAQVANGGWRLELKDGSKPQTFDVLVGNKEIGFSGEPKQIARIVRSGTELFFARTKIDSSTILEQSHQLANCVLRISNGNTSQLVALRRPVEDLNPATISFDVAETCVPVNGITNWPKSQLLVDIPRVAESKAATVGYSLESRRTEAVRIATNRNGWPQFELRIDSKKRQVCLNSEWSLLQEFQGSDRIGQAQRHFGDLISSKTERRDSLQRKSGGTPPEIKRRENEIKQLNNELRDLDAKKQLITAVQNSGILQTAIPFFILIDVEGVPVLIAKSKFEQSR